MHITHNIEQLKQHLQGLALADAVLCPEWSYRYFSFNAHWDVNANEQMASMRDGEGSEFFLLFSDLGVAAKVFDPEMRVTLDLNIMPDSFSSFKNEVAFSLNHTSYLFWREITDSTWQFAPQHLDHYPHLELITGTVEAYWQWAQDYYDLEIDFEVLAQVMTTRTISASQLAILNPELSWDDLQEDLQQILGESTH